MNAEQTTERWCVVANVIEDSALRNGAKVVLCQFNGGGESVEVEGLNKQGRKIRKYIRFKKLENFRAAMAAPRFQGLSYAIKELAQDTASYAQSRGEQ